MSDPLIEALADLDEATVLELVPARLAAQVDPQEILVACRDGMTRVGQRYESGEYFVSESWRTRGPTRSGTTLSGP